MSETITATIISGSDTIRAEVNVAPRGPIGPAGQDGTGGGNASDPIFLAAVGDSNTDSTTGTVAGTGATVRYLWRSWLGFASAITHCAFLPTENHYPPTGIGFSWDFGYGGSRVAELMYASVNERSDGGNKWPGVSVTPFRAAAETNPAITIVFAGTNNIPTETAEQVLSAIGEAVALVSSTGSICLVGEIIPRMETEADPAGTYEAKIVEVNAGLPALAALHGATVIPWHDALTAAGVASAAYFNDENASPSYISRIHANMAGHAVMGQILATTLQPFLRGAYPFPAKGSAGWLSGNAYMDIGTGVATGFAEYAQGTFEIVEDEDGTSWQQCTLDAAGSCWVYAPAIPSQYLTPMIASGKPVRCCVEYEIVSGDCITFDLAGIFKDAGGTQLASGGQSFNIVGGTEGVLPLHRGTFMSAEFAIPETTTQTPLAILATFSGAAVFRIRKMGWFVSPFGYVSPTSGAAAWSDLTGVPAALTAAQAAGTASIRAIGTEPTDAMAGNTAVGQTNVLEGVTGTAPIIAGAITGKSQTISISAATTSAAGSMSAADKTKLDGATDAATASTLVLRDGFGNFAGNYITANYIRLTGNDSRTADFRVNTVDVPLSASRTYNAPDGSGTFAFTSRDDGAAVESIGFACSDETTVLTTGQKIAFPMPYDFTITRVYGTLNVAPVATALEVDIEDAGTSLLAAALSFATTTGTTAETSSFSGSLAYHAMSKGDILTVDIDVVGTSNAGLKIFLEGYRP